MKRRHLSRVAACAVAIAAGVIGLTAAGEAQDASCASTGGGLAAVTVDQPSPDATVSGTVEVAGSAQAAVGFSLSRVEITFRGRRYDAEYAPSPTIDFSRSIDTGGMEPGPATLRVVACSQGVTGVLARGERQLSVTIHAPSTPTTSASRSTTTIGAQPGAQGGAAGPTTTLTGQAVPVGRTTLISSPPITEPRAEVFKPDPVKPKSAADAPLVLTETPAHPSPRPPLWVGAVVGVSGALGLGFSAVSRRRRSHHPDRAEPLDPDLVEVG